MADTAFTAFCYTITGGTVCRLEPDRWHDTTNVMDFGAKNDGVTDDTAACQAAINYAYHNGVGTVFFPANHAPAESPQRFYLVTATLTFPTTGGPAPGNGAVSAMALVGAGRGDFSQGSTIQGNVANGYLVDKPDNGSTSLYSVRYLRINNLNSTTQSGGLRMEGCPQGEVIECTIGGYYGLSIQSNSYNVKVRDVVFPGAPGSGNQAGSIGIIGSQVTLDNISITGYDVGCQMQNVGVGIVGSRFEVNNTGILIGQGYPTAFGSTTGTSLVTTGFVIEYNSFERNGTGIYLFNVAGGKISGNAVTGTTGPASGSTCQYGIRCGSCQYVNVSGLVVSGPKAVGGIVFDSAPINCVFEAVNVANYMSITVNTTANAGATSISIVNVNSGSTGGVQTGSFPSDQQNATAFTNGTTINSITPGAPGTIGLSAPLNGTVTAGDTIQVQYPSWVLTADISGLTVIGCNGSNTAAAWTSSVIIPAQTFANRPQAGSVVPPVAGKKFLFTDSNTVVWGATIAGGGANFVEGMYDGTVWTVVAK